MNKTDDLLWENIEKNIENNIAFNRFNKNSNINILSNISHITELDEKIINYYTGERGFEEINNFLYLNIYNINPNSSFYKLFGDKYKTETQDTFRKRLLYNFFIGLFNIIYNSPKLIDRPFILFRGTMTWYLRKAVDKFYYINSFISTSTKYNTAHMFGEANISTHIKPIYRIYTFLVHPLCAYMNVKPFSEYNEDEILITPYHRYIYIGTNVKENVDKVSFNGTILKENITEQRFIIFPSDLNIPNTFETFMPWKDNITKISKIIEPRIPKSGGKLPLKLLNTNRTFNNIYKKINNKTIRNKLNRLNTIKNKTNTKNIKKEAYNNRFTNPIPSFPGKAPTEREKEVINQMIKFF